MSPIKHRIWMAKPLLVAYVIVLGTILGLLVNRSPGMAEAVPAMADQAHQTGGREREAEAPPLWIQLFRPSATTARLLVRTALPTLPLEGGGGGKSESRNLLILWTGQAGERPQSLFQVIFPFMRPRTEVARTPPAQPPGGQPPAQTTPAPGPSPPPAPNPGGSAGTKPKPEPQSPPPPKPESEVLGGGLPLVGIYHTHDWEAYISEFPGLKVTNEQEMAKIASFDHAKRTIVNIGESLAHDLRDLGVTTVHAPFKHQELGYDYAYQASRVTAKQILKTAPSVRILMDLHRDGTWGLDSTTVINGKNVARIRCVIGARDDQATWQKNKSFCDALMARLEKAHPGLTLPTITAQYRYNQDLLPGAILLEMGNAMNSYEEAERAAGYLAEAVVEMIKAGEVP